jgi:hypothetical protein
MNLPFAGVAAADAKRDVACKAARSPAHDKTLIVACDLLRPGFARSGDT